MRLQGFLGNVCDFWCSDCLQAWLQKPTLDIVISGVTQCPCIPNPIPPFINTTVTIGINGTFNLTRGTYNALGVLNPRDIGFWSIFIIGGVVSQDYISCITPTGAPRSSNLIISLACGSTGGGTRGFRIGSTPGAFQGSATSLSGTASNVNTSCVGSPYINGTATAIF